MAWGEALGRGPNLAAGTGGAEHLSSALLPRLVRKGRQQAALQAGLEPAMGEALGSPGWQRQGRRDTPSPSTPPSPSA